MTQHCTHPVRTQTERRRDVAPPLVFIGGCPRSGTTLLQRMLNHHPQLAIVNDSHFVPRALQKASKASYAAACRGEPVALTTALIEQVWSYHRFRRMGIDRNAFTSIAGESATYAELVARLFAEVASQSGKRFAGEKTPDYVRHTQLLRGLFPQVTFVHLVRDGRNTALSLLQWTHRSKGPGRFVMWDADPVATCALWWKSFVLSDPVERADRGCRTIRYEDLLEQPDSQLANLCELLALPYSDRMLHFHRGKVSASNGSAKSRWLPVTKGLRDWRTSMVAEDVATFELLAGDALEYYGYALSGFKASVTAKSRAQQALVAWQNGRPQRFGRKTNASTAADTEITRKDRLLPGLPALIDPALFRQCLPDQVAAGASPVANYVRYKPNQSCLVGYVQFGQPWGYSIAYPVAARDKRRKAAKRISKERARLARISSPRSAGWIDNKRAIATYRFPFDHKLPALALLAGAADIQRLDRFLDTTLGGFPGPHAVSTLSYKPARRAVLQIANEAKQKLVARVYSKKEYRVAAAARKYIGDSGHDPAPRIGQSDRHSVVFTEWVAGSPVSDAAPLEVLREAGGMIADVHQRMNVKLPVMTLRMYLRQMGESAASWAQVFPARATQIESAARRVADSLSAHGGSIGLAHGDFHHRQLLQTGSGLVALDWDNACNAPHGVDLGSFAAALILSRLSEGKNDAQMRVESFLDGYRDDAVEVPANAGSFVAAGLLRIGAFPFRQRHPQWVDVSQHMLDEINRWLPDDSSSISVCSPTGASQRCAPVTRKSIAAPEVEPWSRSAVDPEKVWKRTHDLARRKAGLDCELAEIAILHHVPQRRCVIKYTWNTPDERLGIIAKCRQKGLDLYAINAQQQLHRAAGPRLRLRLAEPLGVIPQWNAWLQEEIPGTPIHTLLKLGAIEPFRHAGEALAEFHALDVAADRVHTTDDELSILTAALRRVRKKRPQWASTIKKIERGCGALLASVPQSPAVGLHRDFYPAQVLYDEGRVSVVDCDLFARGDPAVDLGNFLAHLQEQGLRDCKDTDAYGRQQIAFLEGYGSRTDYGDESVRIFAVISLARHIFISRRIKKRRKLTKSLISVVNKQVTELA